MCLYNKVKQGNHLSPRFIRKEKEVRDKVMIEIDPEITVGKDKVLVKTGVEMTMEGMGTCKISLEIIAETEAETLTVTIVVTGVGQEKEDYLPEGIIIIIIGKTQILDSGQGPGVGPTQEKEQIETELDVIGAESMTLKQMNVQMLSQVILKVMNQIMQLYKLWPQTWNQMIRKILIDTWKIQNI